ncbi:hypothetical protein KH263_19720 (plasmid) [Bacillus velezensis]|uniref:Uncharacterized protein n=2 Tax=Bacillus amyloliquefaciens group TaxID=1938374 RepID=A0AAI8N280_9BACI|nr:hypothetical protein [Bacillus siamensis]AUJ79451.1 hypothetical protein CWD84_21975 [Bacillus siamensis]QVL41479.1 hypothetical protein KH263_19720 [Bacillus velezensis]
MMENESSATQPETSTYEDVKQALTDFFGGYHKDESEHSSGIVQALNDFYHSYVVDTAQGAFQVFRSFTYGELLISFLLFCCLLLFIFKWIWEVLR